MGIFINLIEDCFMTRVKLVKLLGFIGALLTGGASLVAGDIVTGFGIFSAALTSAGIFSQ